jgi:hypothetical protein
MGYLDAGTGSMLVAVLAGGIFGVINWVLNILGLINAAKIGQPARIRLILHIIGIILYPIGMVLGLIWVFKWRKSDVRDLALQEFPPPPPPIS